MFPVEALPARYYEERNAAEAAKKLAEQQKEAAQKAQSQAPVSTQQSSPSSLGHAMLQQRPPVNRTSSGLLGNIFQSFTKKTSSTPSPTAMTPAATPPRSATPCSNSNCAPSEQQKREMEVALAERIKAADRYAVPGWY